MSARILILDPDGDFARGLENRLRASGQEALCCITDIEARAQFPVFGPDVVVVDDVAGLSFMEEVRPLSVGTVFVVVSADPELDTAVDVMRRGAFDFVSKRDEQLVTRIERGAEVALLRRRMAEASAASPSKEAPGVLLGESHAMRKLQDRMRALAGSDDTTVLITGETGCGKGVVARTIHAQSQRSFEPFVAVDCTTIPATLVESELFGFEKGAFSGADRAKVGRVEAAGKGTLFLDEIGELEMEMQKKLLRLLEEREFTRVGGTRAKRLSARFITATNRRLDKAVREGRFRADLRYRLAVFMVEVPPLRERGDDIILLANHFAAERARVLGRAPQRFHKEVLALMPLYPFPGNVRELRNMVEQAVLLSSGDELVLDDFPVLERVARRTPSVMPPPLLSSIPPPAALPGRSLRRRSLEQIRQEHDEDEQRRVMDALEFTGGNVTAAARRMGLSRFQLIRRMKKYGIE